MVSCGVEMSWISHCNRPHDAKHMIAILCHVLNLFTLEFEE